MVDFYSLNMVILVGYVAGEIENGRAKNGKEWVRFTLATNEIFQNKERHAEFHRIVAWGKKAGLINKWASKGKCMEIVGKLRHNRFTNEYGREQYTTTVSLEDFTWLGRKKDFEWPDVEGEEEKKNREDEPI